MHRSTLRTLPGQVQAKTPKLPRAGAVPIVRAKLITAAFEPDFGSGANIYNHDEAWEG